MNTGVVIGLLVIAVVTVSAQFGDEGHHEHKHFQEYIDYRAHPKYHYDYAVHDLKHHDFKSQHEVRDGKEVKGRYELLQPDGRKRIVEYIAGKHGADYRVKYEGKSEHGGIGGYGGF